MFGGQTHTRPLLTPVPPPVLSMPTPHQILTEDERSYQDLALSKMLKEARQLGCGNFNGTSDAMVAKNLLKKVSEIFEDMGLEDEMKLKVTVRLLEKMAET